MVNSYSLDIQRELEAKYQENSYIIGIEKAKLAKKCNLTKTQVKNWFLRRRLRGNNENNLDRSGKLCEAAKVVLERKFKKNIFISRPERAKLSKEIQLTEMQILSWFCEKRKKLGVTKECAFPEDVRNELKRTFNKKNYISKVERKNLADKLNITEVQVKNWFNELRKRLGKTRNHIRAQQIKQTLEKQKKERQNLALETAKIWRESHVTLLEESQVDLADFSLNNELKDTPKVEPTTSPSINGPDYNNELNESKRKIFELNKLREDLQISNSKKSQDIESLKIQLKTQYKAIEMLNAKFDFSNRCYSQSLNATNAQNNMLEHLIYKYRLKNSELKNNLECLLRSYEESTQKFERALRFNFELTDRLENANRKIETLESDRDFVLQTYHALVSNDLDK